MTWTTASEVRNAGFWVERSLNGIAFEALSFVAGAGSSVWARSYGYDDVVTCGAISAYHRLRQVDTNGSAQHSPVRLVAFEVEWPIPSQLLAAPVPLQEGLLLLYFLLATPLTAADLTLAETTGRQLRQRPVSAPASPGTLAVPELTSLPAGLHLLRLTASLAR
ncbi:hypothetical protein [Hymenobacter negativus]|uniref:Uncharacterized protein n=1 Tax=Hymenobacter negativus TaxID=2795026 RepID=A0ABS3QIY0_9BACT|nr:hypothetical protein [Hymenobacter negativus]MBO2011204.1 hypothetical protein [Hymenobacter negativus]